MNKKRQFTLLLTLVVLLTSFSGKAQTSLGELKAAFKANTGKVYFFTKDKYYRYDLSNQKLENNGQNLSNWKGLSKGFDASLYNPKNGRYYFFKGSTYYKYDFKKGTEYRGKIGVDGWRGVPENIDATVVSPTNKNIVYFFKGNKYYRYSHDSGKVNKVAPLTNWKGLPSRDLDAVLSHKNGKLYFFKGNKYYEYNFPSIGTEKVGIIGKDYWKGVNFKLSSPQLPSEKVRVKNNILLPFASRKTNIKYVIRNGKTFFEDDIVLGTASQVVRPRPKSHPKRPDFKAKYDKNKYGYIKVQQALTAVNSDECLWAFGIVPYEFDASDNWTSTEKNEIIKVLKKLDRETNLTLIPRNGHVDYLEIEKNSNFPKDGGSSYVGRAGGGQEVVLGSTSQYMVAHEVLHAAGFYHEQTRPDRDRFITINWENLDGHKWNFYKHEDARPLGPYDYNSIMHYGPYDFSKDKNTKPVIVRKNSSKIINNKYKTTWLTDIDVDGVNFIYKKDYKSLTTPPLRTLRKLEIVVKKIEAKSGSDGCGEVEFFSNIEIGEGHTWIAGASGNSTLKKQSGTVKGRNILPNWKHTGLINKNIKTAKIAIKIKEEDGGFCFTDDWADINPLNGVMELQLLVKLTDGKIYIWDAERNKKADYVGQVGQDIILQGFEILDNDNDESIPMHIEFQIDVKSR